MRKITILIISLLFLISCKEKETNPLMLYLKQRYTEDKKALKSKYTNHFFKSKHTNHFPKDIDSVTYMGTLGDTHPVAEQISFMLQCKINESNLKHVEKLKKKSKVIYEATDTCLFVINRFFTTDFGKLGKVDDSLIDQDYYRDKLPVPNLHHFDYSTDSTSSRLPEDFKLYVLDAEKGIFLDMDMLPCGKYMPDYWKHGYSKGFAISEKREIIIYWIVIW